MVMAILTSTSTALLAGPINFIRTNYHGWADPLHPVNDQVAVFPALDCPSAPMSK
jgi:hypothetical protein